MTSPLLEETHYCSLEGNLPNAYAVVAGLDAKSSGETLVVTEDGVLALVHEATPPVALVPVASVDVLSPPPVATRDLGTKRAALRSDGSVADEAPPRIAISAATCPATESANHTLLLVTSTTDGQRGDLAIFVRPAQAGAPAVLSQEVPLGALPTFVVAAAIPLRLPGMLGSEFARLVFVGGMDSALHPFRIAPRASLLLPMAPDSIVPGFGSDLSAPPLCMAVWSVAADRPDALTAPVWFAVGCLDGTLRLAAYTYRPTAWSAVVKAGVGAAPELSASYEVVIDGPLSTLTFFDVYQDETSAALETWSNALEAFGTERSGDGGSSSSAPSATTPTTPTTPTSPFANAPALPHSLAVGSAIGGVTVFDNVGRLGLASSVALDSADQFDTVSCLAAGDLFNIGVPTLVVGTYAEEILVYVCDGGCDGDGSAVWSLLGDQLGATSWQQRSNMRRMASIEFDDLRLEAGGGVGGGGAGPTGGGGGGEGADSGGGASSSASLPSPGPLVNADPPRLAGTTRVPRPIFGLQVADANADGLDELVVVTMAGLHVMRLPIPVDALADGLPAAFALVDAAARRGAAS